MTYKEAIDVFQQQMSIRYHADLAPFISRDDLFKMDNAIELAVSALKKEMRNEQQYSGIHLSGKDF